MTYEEKLQSTFIATKFDSEIAESLCKKLVSMYEEPQGELEMNHEMDISDVGEVLSMSIAAFPGLGEFVENMISDCIDVEHLTIEIRELPSEQITALATATRNIALTAVMAEDQGGFDWSDINSLAAMCRTALKKPEPAEDYSYFDI